MKPSLRCTEYELPDLPGSWTWGGSQERGWIALLPHGDQIFRVEASVVGDDGIQICASVAMYAAHAPLVVILAVAMANGVDIILVAQRIGRPGA